MSAKREAITGSNSLFIRFNNLPPRKRARARKRERTRCGNFRTVVLHERDGVGP